MLRHAGTQTLLTRRLRLRPYVREDYRAMYENWTSDPQVAKYVNWGAHSSPDVTRSLVEMWVEGYESPTVYRWGIEKDGELIFKKYSPIGELGEFAADLCDSLRRAADATAAVCDRDSVIAVAGGVRKELMGKSVSSELEKIMDRREFYRRGGAEAVPACEGAEKYAVSVAAPILCEGDVAGCVLFLSQEAGKGGSEAEEKLARAAAHFLGRQMEG
jgi:AbrB family transcriptional regulator (stage V sporulation protein T)